MTYEKPAVRYTDMAIFIDNKVHSNEKLTKEDEDTIYIYLYHLILMLSRKRNYFNQFAYYDDFALQTSEFMMYRLLYNPKLSEIDENGEYKLTKIKSVLNYLKSTLYGRKVDYEQEHYTQQPNNELQNSLIDNSIRQIKRSSIDDNFKTYLTSLSKTLNNFIYENTIYRDNIVLLKNIKISCLLSILNSITFTNSELYDIKTKYTKEESKFLYLCKLYKLNRDNFVILYHLDDSFHDYIKIMVRRLFSIIEDDLKDLIVEAEYTTEDIMLDIIYSKLREG